MSELGRELDGASLVDIVRQGHLPVWMYKLHEKVNDKLNKQSLVSGELQNDADVAMQLLRNRQIEFDCLVKRFTVRPVAFSDGDMWDMLKLFALNVDNRVITESRDVFENWLRFLSYLPLMVHIAGGSSSLVSALKYASQLMHRAGQTSCFDRIVFSQNRQTGCACTGNNSLMSNMMSAANEKEVFSVATARVCKDGSCK